MMMNSLRLCSSHSALRLPVRTSHPRLQNFASPPATKSRQLRNTATMAATTAMQKSNRLRTAFVEKEGPSYGIWVLLSTMSTGQYGSIPSIPIPSHTFPPPPPPCAVTEPVSPRDGAGWLPQDTPRCQHCADDIDSKCFLVPTCPGRLRGRIPTGSWLTVSTAT